MSASFIVFPHAHPHLVSLLSLLNVKFTPFPSLPSPSASSSRVSTSLPGRTRSWCQSPDAPARWRESGRLSTPLQTHVPRQQPRFPVLRRRHHDFQQCMTYAEFRSIIQQPQSRSKQSFVPVRSYKLTGNWSRSCVKSLQPSGN